LIKNVRMEKGKEGQLEAGREGSKLKALGYPIQAAGEPVAMGAELRAR
jgi:hypothetical protein